MLLFLLWAKREAFGGQRDGSGNAVFGDQEILVWDRPATRTAALAASQADNTVVATGTVAVAGALNKTQAGDTLVAAGAVAIAGTLNKTQADETLVATGVLPIVGTLSVTQANETLAGTGTLPVVGTLNVTQADNTLVGVANDPIAAVLAATQAADSLAGSGVVAIVGTLTRTQDDETLVATGINGQGINGSLTATQDDQTLVGTGITAVGAVLNVTQAGDSLVATGAVSISGSLDRRQDDQFWGRAAEVVAQPTSEAHGGGDPRPRPWTNRALDVGPLPQFHREQQGETWQVSKPFLPSDPKEVPAPFHVKPGTGLRPIAAAMARKRTDDGLAATAKALEKMRREVSASVDALVAARQSQEAERQAQAALFKARRRDEEELLAVLANL